MVLCGVCTTWIKNGITLNCNISANADLLNKELRLEFTVAHSWVNLPLSKNGSRSDTDTQPSMKSSRTDALLRKCGQSYDAEKLVR